MRVTADTKPASWSGTYTTGVGTAGQSEKSESGSIGGESHTWQRSDVTKVKMSNGWRNPTAYESLDIVSRNPIAQFKQKYGFPKPVIDNYDGPAYVENLPAIPVRDPSEATWNSLYYTALSKAKGEVINIAVTLAELGESIELIRSRSKLFGELFDLARAKRWTELLRHLGINKGYNWRKAKNDISGRWLELSFGWLPILSDIHNAIDAIGTTARNTGYTVVARASRPSQATVEEFSLPLIFRRSAGYYVNAYLGNSYGDPLYPRLNTKCRRKEKEGYRVNLWFRVNNPKLQAASALGLTNPASVIWELTRLSWFADFFVDIGNWLSALDTFGLEFLGGTKVWWYESELELVSAKYDAFYAPDLLTRNLRVGDGMYRRKHSIRRTITGAPPPFYIKNPFDTWKVITTCALVGSKFR